MLIGGEWVLRAVGASVWAKVYIMVVYRFRLESKVVQDNEL